MTHLALMGAPIPLMEDVYASVTTDAAMDLIHAAGYDSVWKRLAKAAQRYCSLRVRGEIQIEIVFVDGHGSVLGRCVEGNQ